MKAYIQPLDDSKYYGTDIVIPDIDQTITIWKTSGYHKASDRQLESWGYQKNDIPDSDLLCDSHYETQYCLNVCQALCDKINEIDWKALDTDDLKR